MRAAGGMSYKRAAAAGAAVYLLFFIYCLAAHFDFSVMGVSDPRLTRLAKEHLALPALLFEARVLAAYLLIGAGAGLFAVSVLNAAFSRRRSGRGRGEPLLRIALLLLILAFHLAVLGRSVVLYPQLFTEFMYEGGGFWKELQVFLTDRAGLMPFNAALATMAAALVISVIINVLRRMRERGGPGRTAVAAGSVMLAAVLFLVMLLARPRPLVNRGPNILLISSDSVRPDRMSAYGFERDTTPALAGLAARGTRFDNVYVQLPRTFPSWLCTLTGKLPFQHGITSMFPSVADRQKEFEALPAILKREGYATAVVSDYAGDIFPRIELGFDTVEAPVFNFTTLAKMRGLEIHTHLLPYLANRTGRKVFPILKEFASLGNPAFVQADVRKLLQEFRGEEKFFLTVFFSATHFPYSPPWPYYRMYSESGYRGLSKYSKFNRINVEEELTEADRRQVRAVFDGAIRATDDAVRDMVDALADYGLAENTIIVFTSDHGENLYEHEYMMGHGDHLRGPYSLRAPLIILHPKRRFEKGVVKARLRSIDLMPTLLELVGMKAPEGLPARSLVPYMKGERDDDLPVYAETGLWFIDRGEGFFQEKRIVYPDVTRICWFEQYYNNEIVLRDEWKPLTEAAKHRMLIRGKWKLIYCPLADRVEWELYDLEADPEERNDLSKENPGALESMKRSFFELVLDRPGWTRVGDYYLPQGTER